MKKSSKRLLFDIAVLLLAAGVVGYFYVTRIIPQETLHNAIAFVNPSARLADYDGLLAPSLRQKLETRLSEHDIALHESTARQALDHAADMQRETWENPESGHSGAVIPIRLFRNAEQLYCREYMQSISLGENTYDAIGFACRRADNTWKMVEHSENPV